MSDQDVIKFITTPMQTRWKMPDRYQSKDIALSDYFDDLGKFSPEVLRKAFTDVRQGHKYPNWPNSGDFLIACEYVKSNQTGEDLKPEQLLILRGNEVHNFLHWWRKSHFQGKKTIIDGYAWLARRWMERNTFHRFDQGIDLYQNIPLIPDATIDKWMERNIIWKRDFKRSYQQRGNKGE